MKRGAFGVALAALLALGTLGAGARADDAAEKEARALFADGNKKIQEGNYVGALEQFRAAYAKFPSVKILLNIGTMLRQLGRDAEAYEAYETYLASPQADGKKKPEVEKLLAELAGKVGRLHVVVKGRATGLRVDGKLVKLSGSEATLRLDPGPHALSAEREGDAPVTKNVVATAGQLDEVTLVVEARHDLPPIVDVPKDNPKDEVSPEPGSMSHRGQLGAILRADIDGQSKGVVAVPGLSFGLGDYVEVSAAALLGKSKGLEPGATVLFLQGALKPMLSVAVPIFFVDGARPGVHASAGLEWDPSRHVGLFVAAGVAAFPNAPMGFDKVVFVPSVGVQPRVF